jgi:tRNA (Thr-GGU) A37 N-methylase
MLPSMLPVTKKRPPGRNVTACGGAPVLDMKPATPPKADLSLPHQSKIGVSQDTMNWESSTPTARASCESWSAMAIRRPPG